MTTISDNLPPRFLNWRMIDGRKVPCKRDGTPCDAHDPANHVTHAEAVAAGFGVAFDLRAEDGLFFLDLDKCLQPDGQWKPEAVAIFTSFGGAWGEVSQSGTGLHILGRCDPSRLGDRRNKWGGDKEFYTTVRFIAFGPTGWAPIGGTATGQDWTDQLLRVVPQREHLGELPEGVDPAYTGPSDDDALIALMLRSTGGAGAMFGQKATVADLWTANAAKLAAIYPRGDGFDHSSADAALMSHLAFWTGKDMPRMDRLFRRSALMREKYERQDYRRDTVQGAARLCRTVYDRPAPAVKGGMPGVAAAAATTHGGFFITVSEMHKHFEGCVYIQDMHRVMLPDGRMMRPEQFNAAYGGYLFQTMPDLSKPTKKAFEALTENLATTFPQAERPCFRPDLPPHTILPDGSVNTYRKPDVAIIQGDVSPFLDLLAKLLPVERDRAILLAYMAAVVQHPGVKFQWAPVLQGCEGNGKTALMSTVAYAVGRRYVHQPKAKQLGGQFNGYLECKVFILVEEVHMAGRREVLDDLKPLITNLEIEIESKGVDQRMIENRGNWAFCTNYQDAVIKSRNDRRYAVFFTAQQGADDLVRDGMDGQYFPTFWNWLNGGGYAAVAWYLTNYPIPADLNPARGCHRAPKTSSNEAAIQMSQGGFESEIVEAAENGTVGFKGGWVSSAALEKLMRDTGYRIGRNKFHDILSGLGYEKYGRAINPIRQEEGKRPTLYRKPGVTDVYERAQGYLAV